MPPHITSIRFAALAIAGLLAATPAGAQTVTNGDFATGNLTGWTANAEVSVGLNYVGSPFVNTTGTGDMAFFGAGETASIGSISQSFTTVIGEVYGLAFLYGATGNPDLSPTAQSLHVTAGDLDVTVGPAAATTDNAALLTPYSFSFTATSTTTTLTFTDVSAGGSSVDGVLDEITVPEPASLALLGLGLAGLAGIRRRLRA